MKHTDRIRKRDHVIAFATGSTVSLVALLWGAAVLLALSSGRDL